MGRCGHQLSLVKGVLQSLPPSPSSLLFSSILLITHTEIVLYCLLALLIAAFFFDIHRPSRIPSSIILLLKHTPPTALYHAAHLVHHRFAGHLLHCRPGNPQSPGSVRTHSTFLSSSSWLPVFLWFPLWNPSSRSTYRVGYTRTYANCLRCLRQALHDPPQRGPRR